MRRGAVASAIIAGGLACIASWLGLLVGAGNVGLQQAVAIGPQTLVEVPLAIILAVVLGAVAAAAAGTIFGPANALLVLAIVLVGDLVGAAILAPIAVGELGIDDAPVVFAVLTTFGLQPAAAAGAALLAARLRASPAADPTRRPR